MAALSDAVQPWHAGERFFQERPQCTVKSQFPIAITGVDGIKRKLKLRRQSGVPTRTGGPLKGLAAMYPFTVLRQSGPPPPPPRSEPSFRPRHLEDAPREEERREIFEEEGMGRHDGEGDPKV